MTRTIARVVLGTLLACGLAACDPGGGAVEADAAADAAPDARAPDAALPDAALPDACVVEGIDREADTQRPITWVAISAGSFLVGCVPEDGDCYACESPRHGVDATAFEITDTEITQHQYLVGTGESPSAFPGCPDCPVDQVGWLEAQAFCVGLGGRLPSEAEWEVAARGGAAGSIFGCGDADSCLDDVAWYRDNSCGMTQPVARKAPNGYGLYDLQGNVWEWVEDCWHDDYTDAPGDTRVWPDGNCTYRVLRGGAFGVSARGLRLSNRDGDYPDGYLIPSPGFRCVRDATALP